MESYFFTENVLDPSSSSSSSLSNQENFAIHTCWGVPGVVTSDVGSDSPHDVSPLNEVLWICLKAVGMERTLLCKQLLLHIDQITYDSTLTKDTVTQHLSDWNDGLVPDDTLYFTTSQWSLFLGHFVAVKQTLDKLVDQSSNLLVKPNFDNNTSPVVVRGLGMVSKDGGNKGEQQQQQEQINPQNKEAVMTIDTIPTPPIPERARKNSDDVVVDYSVSYEDFKDNAPSHTIPPFNNIQSTPVVEDVCLKPSTSTSSSGDHDEDEDVTTTNGAGVCGGDGYKSVNGNHDDDDDDKSDSDSDSGSSGSSSRSGSDGCNNNDSGDGDNKKKAKYTGVDGGDKEQQRKKDGCDDQKENKHETATQREEKPPQNGPTSCSCTGSGSCSACCGTCSYSSSDSVEYQEVWADHSQGQAPSMEGV